MVFSPEGVPSLDESKDAMGVYIAGIRESMVEDQGLEDQDMGSDSLLFDQKGIKGKPTIIIQRCSEIPFLLTAGAQRW